MPSHSIAIHPAPAKDLGGRGQARNVMIVDDNPAVRETLVRIVTALGVDDVLEAGGGNEAIHLLRAKTHFFDLIFCDLQMPNGDGFDVIEACSTLGLNVTLILMSGAGEDVLHAAATHARARGLAVVITMPKPFAIRDVRDALSGLNKSTLSDSAKELTGTDPAFNAADAAKGQRGRRL